MWLLDVNMPKDLVSLLGEFGIVAHHGVSLGWSALTNGVLVETASAQGFVCVLTRDRLFGESAARALKKFPEFSVVLVTIRQVRTRIPQALSISMGTQSAPAHSWTVAELALNPYL